MEFGLTGCQSVVAVLKLLGVSYQYLALIFCLFKSRQIL